MSSNVYCQCPDTNIQHQVKDHAEFQLSAISNSAADTVVLQNCAFLPADHVRLREYKLFYHRLTGWSFCVKSSEH